MSMYSDRFKTSVWMILTLLIVVFVLCAFFANSSVVSAPSSQGQSSDQGTTASNSGQSTPNDPGNSVTIVAIITISAVLIERITETIWIIVGMNISTRWPLKSISGRLNAFAKNLDNDLGPYLVKMKAVVSDAEGNLESVLGGSENVKKIGEDIDSLLLNIKTLPSNSEKVRNVTDKALGLVSRASEFSSNLDTAAETANSALDKVNEFLITLEDNPGRRLISIMLGVIVALPFAWLLGLDVYQATLGYSLPGGLGVALTGFLMGLGATPTHEVIKTLQEVKKNQKSSTQSSQ